MSKLAAAEMKDIQLPAVILILGLSLIAAGTVIWLAILGLDPADILSGLAPIAILLGGYFGVTKVRDLKKDVVDVKELSNGRLTELTEENKRLNKMVAQLSMQIMPPDQKDSS